MLARLFVNLHKVGYFLRGFVYSVIIRSGGGAVGRRLRVESGLIFRQAPHSGYRLGDDIFIGQGSCLDIGPQARLEVGKGVVLTKNVFVSALSHVLVGDYTLIGENSSVRDANHGIKSGPKCIAAQDPVAEGVRIGHAVWIGRGVAVLAGSQIGDGCVIGANAVVRGEIPCYAVAVGIPAKVARFR